MSRKWSTKALREIERITAEMNPDELQEALIEGLKRAVRDDGKKNS